MIGTSNSINWLITPSQFLNLRMTRSEKRDFMLSNKIVLGLIKELTCNLSVGQFLNF